MSLSWKLVPLAVLAVLGFFALTPGGAKPQPAYADACGDESGTLRILIYDKGFQTTVEGFRLNISPMPESTTHTGTLTVVDDGIFDDHGDELGELAINNACYTDHDGFPDGGYTLSLGIVDGSAANTLNCSIVDNIKAGVTHNEATTFITFSVNCNAPAPTPTATGTAATPTSTPTGDTITVVAVPQNPQCGSPAFIFATVRNQAGAGLANQTVTLTATDNLGSFQDASGTTVSDGVFSATYYPPETGSQAITITATSDGKTASTVVTTSCAAAAPTATPTVTSTPTRPQVTPPSTGDAGLAAGGTVSVGSLALLFGAAFTGGLILARRNA